MWPARRGADAEDQWPTTQACGILASGGPTPLPGFLNSLTGPLDHYGYWAIALLLLLENIGVPVVPGEFAMIAARSSPAPAGSLNIVVVAVVAFVASVVGAEIGYLIGRFAGREPDPAATAGTS